ncbi:tyrosine-protein phosphatase non-receptor type 18 [Pholidichthys leucotaenia]
MEPLSSLLSALKSVGPAAVDQEYSVVRSQSLAFKRVLGLTSEAGALKENVKKNRYKDILPYDQTRVVLSPITSASDSDYINASFIKRASSDRCYIACQAPLSSTVVDFWRMIWQHDVKVIVMACREVEMGKKKCECYWAAAHQSASFGPFTVSSRGETYHNEDLVVRELTVSYKQDHHSIFQYQFLSWPDHDVPNETTGVLDLLEQVRMSQGAHTSPLLIHCSAGCGRTGVICAIDYIHDLLVTQQITADFSIMEIVLELRKQRPSAVQTKDQYHFIFTAVISMFSQFLQSSDQLYINLSGLKKQEEKPTRASASSRESLSQQTAMNDTYAVVNKSRHSQPPLSSPIYSVVAKPKPGGGSRTQPPTHHYDNDPTGAGAAHIYSTINPTPKPSSLPHSSTPIYDMAVPSSSGEISEYQLVSADHPSPHNDDYEEFHSSGSEATSLCSLGGIGFNCRVQKPRGPRNPPAKWSRLET